MQQPQLNGCSANIYQQMEHLNNIYSYVFSIQRDGQDEENNLVHNSS